MRSTSIDSPAGRPSRITTSMRPCDSPAVRNRSIGEKLYTKFLRASCAATRACADLPVFLTVFVLHYAARFLAHAAHRRSGLSHEKRKRGRGPRDVAGRASDARTLVREHP